MTRVLLIALATLSLGGCYYGPYYRPRPVYVAPRPVYVRPPPPVIVVP